MKAFISYRFTGEKLEDLKKILIPIQNKLKEAGVDAYCNLFDPNIEVWSKGFEPHDFVFHAFKELDNSNLLFVVITSKNKSEGMIMEVGYSIAKNIPVVIAIKNDITDTYLPGMAKLVIRWDNTDDLFEKVAKIDFKSLYAL